MISLDQVLLLQQKVESAVAKIQQLQAENDALRTKCSELTNALSSKTEQLSTFEVDQNQIESGIKKALDRLNQIENSVLKTVGQAASPNSSNSSNFIQASEPKVQMQPQQTAQFKQAETVERTVSPNPVNNIQNTQATKPVSPVTQTVIPASESVINNQANSIPSFQNMNEAPVFNSPANEPQLQEDFTSDDQNDIDNSDENPDDALTFDIF